MSGEPAPQDLLSSEPYAWPYSSMEQYESNQPASRLPIETHPHKQYTAELGVPDVLHRHVIRHVAEQKTISDRRLEFEQSRPRWYREMAAEAIGVFLFVYPGIASQASLIVTQGNPVQASVFQIGWAYALGAAFAIIACATTSGGHFSPAITLCFAFWQGFPWRKVPCYIFAQIVGALMAGLILMGQYHEQFEAIQVGLRSAGQTLVGPATPAAALAPFPAQYQTNLGWLFMIEFFAGSFVSLVIWAVLDPANPFVSPQSAPFAIGFAYAVMFWGFLDITVSLNLAKDLGLRMVAAVWYGSEAFTYHKYPWISIFVNIPATFFGTLVHEMFLRDSLDRIGLGRAQHKDGEEGLQRYLFGTGQLRLGAMNTVYDGRQQSQEQSSMH